MTLIEQIEKLVHPVLAHRQLRLVQVQFLGQNQRRPVLQVMIERLDETLVTIEDCVGVSRELSAPLDVENLIEGSYKLEVTSPGLDRPLVKIQDFQRFVGSLVKLQTHDLKEGRKKFRGILEAAGEEAVKIGLHEEEFQIIDILYKEIRQAKLEPQLEESKGRHKAPHGKKRVERGKK